MQLTFSQPDAGGTPITDYRVTTSPGGSTFHAYAGAGILMSGLNNGTDYTFSVQACNQGRSKVDYCSDPSPTDRANPYGPPPAPDAGTDRAGPTTIKLWWSAPAPNGREIERVEIYVDSGGWQTAGRQTDNTVVGNDYEQEHCIRARAWSGGLVSAESPRRCRVSDPRPPPPPDWSKARGGANQTTSGTCPARACSIVLANYSNLSPGSHSVTCHINGEDGPALGARLRYVNGGSGQVSTGCYAGNGVTVGIKIDGELRDYSGVNWGN